MVQRNRIIMTFRDTFITHYIKYIHLIQLPEKFHHLNTWQRSFIKAFSYLFIIAPCICI